MTRTGDTNNKTRLEQLFLCPATPPLQVAAAPSEMPGPSWLSAGLPEECAPAPASADGQPPPPELNVVQEAPAQDPPENPASLLLTRLPRGPPPAETEAPKRAAGSLADDVDLHYRRAERARKLQISMKNKNKGAEFSLTKFERRRHRNRNRHEQSLTDHVRAPLPPARLCLSPKSEKGS